MTLPRLTRRQSREVDRILIERFGMIGLVLMENAARSAAEAMADLLATRQTVAVLCGPGNNGGDGLALARHLQIRGHEIGVLLSAPAEKFAGDAAVNLRIAKAMGFSLCQWPGLGTMSGDPLERFDVIVDALFGTGLSRPLTGTAAIMVRAVNDRGDRSVPVVSLDVPSGLDCDTGLPLRPCVRATRTVTFGTEKVGFGVAAAEEFTGQVVVGDIGAPREVFALAAASPP